MPNISKLLVRDLTLDMSIGVYEFEKKAPQRVCVNVEAYVELPDMLDGDNINDVVSYEPIVDEAERLASNGHTNLVETLAQKLADFCLQDDRVSGVMVRVEKLDIFDNAAGVGIEIARTR